jgi:serine/threonine-protein kinase
MPDSTLTTVNTEFKGYFNDPSLVVDGFHSYSVLHETYALTRLLYFIMTGKTNTEKIKDNNLKIFVEKGLSSDKKQRFQTVMELAGEFKKI